MRNNKLSQIWKARDIRNDIIFVFLMLLIFRLVAHIPVPGIDSSAVKEFLRGNQFTGLLNIFTGGGLETFSVVMLGVGPYITSSIIFQLLTMIVPRLEDLSKEGEYGRQKINQWTRLLTLPLAALQAYGTLVFLGRNSGGAAGFLSSISLFQLLTAIISITAGSLFLMWLGELISERKVGNGISLLIFAGIISSIPRSIAQALADYNVDHSVLTSYIIFLVLALIIIAAVIYITEGQRNIPVSYARLTHGSKTYGGNQTHLPLRINQAGVIPIIFAISLLLFPPLLAQFFSHARTQWIASASNFIITTFQNRLIYGILYFVLVFGFTYFYTAIIFHPEQVAENLQKQGGFIPGIRPGSETRDYLAKVTNRIVFTGAVFLGVIAVLPLLMQGSSNLNVVIGGTSLLIVVSVVIETIKQINSQLIMREYEGF
ncbi:MAG: Protein translocase subunit SecY [Parcubacteria group bacterium GW2011_GWA2_44_12]|nr:MAG: Protein translocase subunit SecY [Parcubacteria group bacterium GW2011_GWA2_44_12]